MNINPKKPKLLLNIILSILIIVIAFLIDRSHEHQKAQQRTDTPAASVQQVADTAYSKPVSRAGLDTADTSSETAAKLRREK